MLGLTALKERHNLKLSHQPSSGKPNARNCGSSIGMHLTIHSLVLRQERTQRSHDRYRGHMTGTEVT